MSIEQTPIVVIKPLNSVPEHDFPFFLKSAHIKLALLNQCALKTISMNSNA